MMMESDDDVLSVGAVWPLPMAAPWGGADMVDVSQRHVEEEDDVLFTRAREPIDRPGTCWASLDNFDWIVPPYDSDTLLSGEDMTVGVAEIHRDFRNLPDVLPAKVDETAVMPIKLHVGANIGPQVIDDSTNIRRAVRKLPDVFPGKFEKTAAVPTILPVVMMIKPPVDDNPDVPDMADVKGENPTSEI